MLIATFKKQDFINSLAEEGISNIQSLKYYEDKCWLMIGT